MSASKRARAFYSIQYRVIRLRLWAQQLGRCAYCGRETARPGSVKTDRGEPNPPHVATIDHLHPVSAGAHPLTASNLVMACLACNAAKANLLPLEFIVRRITTQPRTIGA